MLAYDILSSAIREGSEMPQIPGAQPCGGWLFCRLTRRPVRRTVLA